MKNVTVLVEREEIHAYVRGLFHTEEFRRSYDERGFIYEVVDQFADYPKFFFDASDQKLEKAHFSSWWGGIQRRSYPENKAIEDVYYLHEIFHAGTMIYPREDLEIDNWMRKMVDNELDASVCSEIGVYFELPSLREKTFKQRILADKFLENSSYVERWKDEPERVIEEIRLVRRNAMTDQTPRNSSDPRFWIRRFSEQNNGFRSAWAIRYNEVESAMARLQDECRTLGRAGAMDNFMSWLKSPDVTRGTDMPFPDEAKAFAGIYWLNDAFYRQIYGAVSQPPQAQANKPASSAPAP